MALLEILQARYVDQQRILAIDELGQAARRQRLVAAREALRLADRERDEHADETEREIEMIAEELGQAMQEIRHGNR